VGTKVPIGHKWVNNGQLHDNIFKAYKSCFPQKLARQCQQEADGIWKKAKTEVTEDFAGFITQKARDLNTRGAESRLKGSIVNFLSK